MSVRLKTVLRIGGPLAAACGVLLGLLLTTTNAVAQSTGAMPCCDAIEGVPRWMFLFGSVTLLLGTFCVSTISQTGAISLGLPRFSALNLLGIKPIRSLVKKRWFPLAIQTPFILLFVLLTVTGLFGETYTNFAPVFTWTIWWGLLVFIVLFLGKAFCMVCPWDAIAGIVQRGSLFKQRLPLRTKHIPWPYWARNIYPATALFIGLTWLELGFGVTRHAGATAMLGLVMLLLVVGSAIVFERRAFCRYGCLIGRISGLYAMFAPVELRPKNKNVCQNCRTQDCSVGNDRAMACPTFEVPATLNRNTYCTLCTECVRACPHNNLSFNLRRFGTDLDRETQFRSDEAYLAIVLLALTSFHGLTMTPTWYVCTDWVQALTGVGYKLAFTLLMAVCIAAPIGLFWAISALGNLMTSERLGTNAVFRVFAFPLIPIALFYHVAHNVMHFFREAQYVVPRLSDPFGWGWNLFGTARQTYDPLLSLEVIWYLQLGLVLIGHVFGIMVSEKLARKVYTQKLDIWLVQLPMLFVMIVFSLYSLWLIHQPMEMRTGM